MKKGYHIFAILGLLFLCFFLTSCIDVVQTVDYLGKNIYSSTYRITFQMNVKSLYSLMDEDYNDYKDDIEESLKDIESNGGIIYSYPIESDSEVGELITCISDFQSSKTSEYGYLSPLKENHRICIPLVKLSSNDTSNNKEFDVNSFMSEMIKEGSYHLNISKKVIESIYSAKLITTNGNVLTILYPTATQDYYTINIPMTYIADGVKNNKQLFIELQN